MKKILFLFVLLVLIVLSFNQCKKPVQLPVVITVGIKNIGINSVTAYGTLTGLEITAKGFCWDTLNNPKINNTHSDEGEGSDRFQSDVQNLLPGKKYYLCAYAQNDAGIVYGDVINFQTPNVPTLETYVASNVTYSSASVTGFVSPNGHSFTTSGICYDTLMNPDITKKTVLANGTYYNVNLNNLREKKVYYYRAYATFSFGTFYSPQRSFTTSAAPLPIVVFTNTGTVTDVDGTVYKTVKIGNQTWMAENLKVGAYNDGSFIPYINSGLNNWSLVSSGAIGYYGNSGANNSIYGTLYNFYTIEDVRGLAPGGWHIPTAIEWQTLLNTLTSANSSYSLTAIQQLLGISGWSGLSCTSNNYSNMNVLPAGYRNVQGYDNELGISTGFWTTDNAGAYASIMFFDNNCFGMVTSKLKNSGYSIRCVKD